MAGSLNKVTIIGNLGKDPEFMKFQNGNEVAKFSIATSESWRDKQSGERKEKTEWHNIVVNGDQLVDVIRKYVSKGSKLYVEGQLQTRKYQAKDGSERYSTEIVLQGFNGKILLLSHKDGDSGRGDSGKSSQSSSGGRGGSGGGRPSSIQDEDIPFSPEFR